MTRRFILTSTAFEGDVIFEYNEGGLLERYDISGASLSENQHIWMLKNLPRELCELQRVLGNSGTAKLTEVSEEITFDKFWNRYDEKDRSSKKKALAKWNRMSKSQQAKAYWYIPKYFSSIPLGVAKKYAETYLNAELWNN